MTCMKHTQKKKKKNRTIAQICTCKELHHLIIRQHWVWYSNPVCRQTKLHSSEYNINGVRRRILEGHGSHAHEEEEEEEGGGEGKPLIL